jgi:hypothetical protein
MTERNLGGRPSTYTPEVAAEICRRLSEGELLRDICAPDGMPAQSTVHLWLGRVEGFLEAYTQARASQMRCWAEQAVQIADDCKAETNEVAKARLRSETRLKLLPLLAPQIFGAQQKVEHSGAVIVGSVKITDAPLGVDEWAEQYGKRD